MIKSGFKEQPKVSKEVLTHWEYIIDLMKVSEVEYTQDYELVVLQLCKALALQDVYEESILTHGAIIDDGKGKLRTNPSTVSLASTKANINALMIQLMLSPKSQGKEITPPKEKSHEEIIAELLEGVDI